jgi:hypothetical protein
MRKRPGEADLAHGEAGLRSGRDDHAAKACTRSFAFMILRDANGVPGMECGKVGACDWPALFDD